MAVDRGITNFMFDDYWVDSVDHPTIDTSSNALLGARYRDHMSFAMLYNQCETPANPSAGEDRAACFREQVLPFYVSQYFSLPNYLKIEGRPVIQLLAAGLAAGTYIPSEINAFLAEADDYIAQHSEFEGAYWITGDTPYTAGGTIDFSKVAAAGLDAVAPYYVLPYVWPDPYEGWLNYPISRLHPL